MLGLASIVVIGLIVSSFRQSQQEEGMYPLAQLGNLNLKEAGLRIPVSEIYTPGQVGLTNALVRLGGCTGSFISDEGLIITNHHCVFGSVASVSTPENNYLDNGFYAADKKDEIKTSLPCRITLSFEDVSMKVMDGVHTLTNPAERSQKIRDNIKALEKEESEKYPDLEISISEMFVGRFYTLFRYKLLNDVRLVYVPPQTVGKFGGETDNWVWPRHNGDFSVVRAYENDQPYKPERHLKINANGTDENDFVFILGYPGRTYRHTPAEFLSYQYEHILPVISSWFGERIDMLEQDARGNTAKRLQYAGTLASLHNTAKNFRGKIQGLTRTNLVSQRYAEQEELKKFVSGNASLRTKYGHVFDEMSALYKRKMEMADEYILLNQLYSSSGIFHVAAFIDEYGQLKKEKGDDWLTDNKDRLTAQLRGGYRIHSDKLDMQFTARLLERLHKSGHSVDDVWALMKIKSTNRDDIEAALWKHWKKSKWLDAKSTMAKWDKNPGSFLKQKNKLVKMASLINDKVGVMSEEWRAIDDKIDVLMPLLAEVREAYSGETFVPDANSTLRLTYGYVKGYSPQDAVYNEPFTTLSGILEKADPSDRAKEEESDYYMPADILETFKRTEASDKLVHPKHKQVVVGMLYNLDTTGGNSGSPILDADGNLVGINFDRAYTATINDFAWNESYSRSIGVDIRYVLYVMKYIGGADEVLSEMGVKL